MPTIEKAASDYTEYVKKRASVVGRREFSDSLFNSLILQSSVGRGLGNTPEGPPPTPSGEYGVFTGFDYSDKVLYYPNFGDPGDFTVEFFFKCWDVNTAQDILSLNTAEDNITIRLRETGILDVYYSANYNNITSVIPETWYHVGLTRSGSSWYASINGSTFEIELGSSDLTDADLCIGDYEPSDTPFFSGSISNFRISGPLYTPGTYTIPSLPLSASGAKLLLLAKPGAEFADSTGTYVSQYSCGWEAGPIPSIPQPRTDYGVLTVFSGDNVLRYPNFGTLPTDFTIEFFFNASIFADQYLFGIRKDNLNSEYLRVFVNDGSYLVVQISDSETSESENLANMLSTNTWYHVAITRSGSITYASVNGNTVEILDIEVDLANASLCIGDFKPDFDTFTSSSISNFRISNYARYTASYTVPTIPMTPSATDLLLLLAKPDAPFEDTVLLPRTAKVSETNCGWAPGPIDLPTTDYGVLTGFDDSGSILYYPSFGSLPTNFTVEFFFKYSDILETYDLYILNISNRVRLYIEGDILKAEIYASSSWNNPVISSLALNTWYHFGLTRSGSDLYASINGQTSLLSGLGLIDPGDTTLCIGDLDTNDTPFISGSISNFRISSVAKYTNPTLGYTVPSVPLQSESTDLLLLLAKPDAPFADTIFPNSGRTPKEPENTCKWGPGPIVAPITNYGVLTGFDTNLLVYNSFPLTANFTIECFFKIIIGTSPYIFTIDNIPVGIGGYISFYSNGSELKFEGVEDIIVGQCTLDTWYHVALTRNGSNFYVSLNGNTQGWGNDNSVFNTPTINIGGYIPENPFALNGSISNFRISNYARYTTNYYQVPSVPMTPASTDLLLLLAQPNAKFVDSSSYNRTSETTCKWGPGEPIVV